MSEESGLLGEIFNTKQPDTRDESLLRVAEAVQLLLELISFLPVRECRTTPMAHSGDSFPHRFGS